MLRSLKSFLLSIIFFAATAGVTIAQPCPANVGFEDGTFNNWQCYIGDIAGGNLVLTASPPTDNRHTIKVNSSPQEKDVYGNFPVNCPNGSGYSIKLGNDIAGHQAERVTYTYTIPAGKNNFTLIYYYAAVLQNGGHTQENQAAFIAGLKDLTTGKAVPCGNNTFTPLDGVTGFQVSNVDASVYYKEWTPVVINLTGCAGHTIELDFTTHDCTQTKHFGYAYLDFDEICDPSYEGPLVGNNFCDGSEALTLTAPPGFSAYAWYDSGFVNKLGTNNNLTISPLPVEGTQYAVIVTPPSYLGCVDTFYTTVKHVTEPFVLKVASNVNGCKADGVDLTQASVTAGSSPNMKYSYYLDSGGQNFLSDPKLVTASGTYYIRGTNTLGCTDIQPVQVSVADGPILNLVPPKGICQPATIDLTSPAIVSTAEAGVTFSYFSDELAKIPVADPQHIGVTGTYYVKATGSTQCVSIVPVSVIVSPLPEVKPLALTGCPPLNLTSAFSDPDNSVTYSFYSDAAATKLMTSTDGITASNTYYYRAINTYGCQSNIAPIVVTVYPIPVFTVTDPVPVTFPATDNLANAHTYLAGVVYTYWLDSLTTKPLDNYQAVGVSGTFYIKSSNQAGCTIVHPVHVLINASPEGNIIAKNTFTPNGDGINDLFDPTTEGAINVNYLKIFNRYGQQIFETKEISNHWDGTVNGKPEPAGTYYWVFSCYDLYRKKEITKSGSITIIR